HCRCGGLGQGSWDIVFSIYLNGGSLPQYDISQELEELTCSWIFF
ncbi:hypothetical protein ACHAXS_011272, partial [Conticribra weissflogii]